MYQVRSIHSNTNMKMLDYELFTCVCTHAGEMYCNYYTMPAGPQVPLEWSS